MLVTKNIFKNSKIRLRQYINTIKKSECIKNSINSKKIDLIKKGNIKYSSKLMNYTIPSNGKMDDVNYLTKVENNKEDGVTKNQFYFTKNTIQSQTDAKPKKILAKIGCFENRLNEFERTVPTSLYSNIINKSENFLKSNKNKNKINVQSDKFKKIFNIKSIKLNDICKNYMKTHCELKTSCMSPNQITYKYLNEGSFNILSLKNINLNNTLKEYYIDSNNKIIPLYKEKPIQKMISKQLKGLHKRGLSDLVIGHKSKILSSKRFLENKKEINNINNHIKNSKAYIDNVKIDLSDKTITRTPVKIHTDSNDFGPKKLKNFIKDKILCDKSTATEISNTPQIIFTNDEINLKLNKKPSLNNFKICNNLESRRDSKSRDISEAINRRNKKLLIDYSEYRNSISNSSRNKNTKEPPLYFIYKY